MRVNTGSRGDVGPDVECQEVADECCRAHHQFARLVLVPSLHRRSTKGREVSRPGELVVILKSDIGRRGPERISPRFQERLLPAQSVQCGKGREHVSMSGKTVEQRHLFPTMSLFPDVRTLDACSCLRMLLVLELETLPCRRSSRTASCDMRSAVDSRDPSRGDRYCSSVCTTPARDEKARGKRE